MWKSDQNHVRVLGTETNIKFRCSSGVETCFFLVETFIFIELWCSTSVSSVSCWLMNHVIYLKLTQKQLFLKAEQVHKTTAIFTQNDIFFPLWQYGLSSFQAEYKKLERFLPKNQHYCILRIGLMGRCQKYQNMTKIWLSKSIFYVKNYPNLSHLFFHWRISI